MFKRTLFWSAVFVLPLLGYFSWISVAALRDYEGWCSGLLDAEGPICTKAEFVFNYLFNGFSGGFTLLIVMSWGILVAIAALVSRTV